MDCVKTVGEDHCDAGTRTGLLEGGAGAARGI